METTILGNTSSPRTLGNQVRRKSSNYHICLSNDRKCAFPDGLGFEREMHLPEDFKTKRCRNIHICNVYICVYYFSLILSRKLVHDETPITDPRFTQALSADWQEIKRRDPARYARYVAEASNFADNAAAPAAATVAVAHRAVPREAAWEDPLCAPVNISGRTERSSTGQLVKHNASDQAESAARDWPISMSLLQHVLAKPKQGSAKHSGCTFENHEKEFARTHSSYANAVKPIASNRGRLPRWKATPISQQASDAPPKYIQIYTCMFLYLHIFSLSLSLSIYIYI